MHVRTWVPARVIYKLMPRANRRVRRVKFCEDSFWRIFAHCTPPAYTRVCLTWAIFLYKYMGYNSIRIRGSYSRISTRVSVTYRYMGNTRVQVHGLYWYMNMSITFVYEHPCYNCVRVCRLDPRKLCWCIGTQAKPAYKNMSYTSVRVRGLCSLRSTWTKAMDWYVWHAHLRVRELAYVYLLYTPVRVRELHPRTNT